MNNKELFDRMEWRQSKRKKKLAPMELDLDMVSYAPFIEKGFRIDDSMTFKLSATETNYVLRK